MTGRINFSQPPDFDAARLRELASAQCDETLSNAEGEELEAILLGSAVARSLYVRYLNVHAGLDWEITSGESVAGLVPSRGGASAQARDKSRRSFVSWKTATMAATLLIAVTIAVLSRTSIVRDQALSDERKSADAMGMSQVATVKRLGPNAQWAVTPHPDGSPMELRANDVVCVTAGEIQVMFKSGAEVTLYAPAMMEAISPTRGRAIRGRLAADVSDGAQGFTIQTPQATVVDLGTVFGVEVGDEGATDVVVFKGAVDLHFDRQGGTESPEGSLRLTSGEAMRLKKGSTPSRIVSIYSDRFSSRPDDSTAEVARPVLISAVTDNIDRKRGSWNYYEIVHGGMGEDAKAFVDRVAHEWNGVDEKGMPKFLLGGDYVKTFNNDKYFRDLELFVTIDRPCRLYVLIDDRAPPPAWLSKQFHDTGVKIGLDVGPFHRVEDGVLIDDRVPGIGPGVLVDNDFSIWERTLNKPEVVHLGSNEADHRYINMYGIVAAPLEDN